MKAAMIGRMYLLMLVVFAAAMAHQEGQAKLVVDDDGGAWADYDNIQDALDNASVDETIEVYEGVYTE
ncbi:MAG TPA: hypothetical protein EYP43_00020, partial [Thermoplasmata archaeon]|nr:hypothetical protein [Thermoplasmata archaeon]